MSINCRFSSVGAMSTMSSAYSNTEIIVPSKLTPQLSLSISGAESLMYEGRSRSTRTFAITIVHVYIIKNIVYEMKAGSLIDKSAEFQTNRLMDIKSAPLLVRLVPGGRGTL